jgi:hypothetical protein
MGNASRYLSGRAEKTDGVPSVLEMVASLLSTIILRIGS